MVRIKYITKDGERYDLVLKIVKKLSKVIIVRNPDDGHEFMIQRNAVESISDIQNEKPFEHERR